MPVIAALPAGNGSTRLRTSPVWHPGGKSIHTWSNAAADVEDRSMLHPEEVEAHNL